MVDLLCRFCLTWRAGAGRSRRAGRQDEQERGGAEERGRQDEQELDFMTGLFERYLIAEPPAG